MFFASDNTGPVAPQVMEALVKANEGYTSSYGSDPIMDRVRDRIREVFEAPDAAVYLVATGTAANSLALATLSDPWNSVYCHRFAHIEVDECGAPEFYTGGSKLRLLDGPSGKIDPVAFKAQLQNFPEGDVHVVQRGPLSISQVTEAGTVYSIGEITELAGIAKSFGMACHMDGARFANALATLGCTPAEMSWKAGVDVLSFGGTKNGLMGVEAVVLFNPDFAWEFELRRKRGAHLFSKHRYLSAQMEAYLTDNLWIDLATKANAAAAKLEAGIMSLPGAVMQHERHANMLFTGFSRAAHKRAFDAGAHYYLAPGNQSLEGADDEVLTARLVCNWSTTEADISSFLAAAAG